MLSRLKDVCGIRKTFLASLILAGNHLINHENAVFSSLYRSRLVTTIVAYLVLWNLRSLFWRKCVKMDKKRDIYYCVPNYPKKMPYVDFIISRVDGNEQADK